MTIDLTKQIFRPVLDWASSLCRYLWIAVPWLLFWSIIFFACGDHPKTKHIPNTGPFVGVLLLLYIPLFTTMLIRWALRYNYFKNTSIMLTDNEVIWDRNFLGKNKSIVIYSDIYHVYIHQTYLQSLLGIGDVSFTTHYNNGMYLFDLKEYQEIYDFLLEKSKHNTFPRRRI